MSPPNLATPAPEVPAHDPPSTLAPRLPSVRHPDAFARTTPVERSLVLARFGGTEGFAIEKRSLPVPGPGEIRVRVLAAGVEFTDTLLRRGLYPDLHARPPLVLGYDVVGEIDSLGPGAGEPGAAGALRTGDRVADLTMTGSYATHRLLDARSVVRVPDNVDPAEAVSLVLSWVTAWQLLHREARVLSGQRVLVHGAAGSVGQALIALGRMAGLRMWGTARAEHAAMVRAAGATPVDYRTEDCRKLVRGGFGVVFDGVGDNGFADSRACVARGGTLIGYGFSAPAAKGTSMARVGWWMLRLHLWNSFPGDRGARFYSITAMRKSHPEWYRSDLGQLLTLLAEGLIHPRIAERIGLEGVAEAHRHLEAGGLDGKIILCPDRDAKAAA